MLETLASSLPEKAAPEKVERFGQTVLSPEDIQGLKGQVEATLISDEPNSVYKAIDQLSYLKRAGVGGSVRLNREKLTQQREQLQRDPQTLAKYLVRMRYLGLMDKKMVAEVSEPEKTLILEQIDQQLAALNTKNFAELCVSAKHLGIAIPQKALDTIRSETDDLVEASNNNAIRKTLVDTYIKRRAQARYLGIELTDDQNLEETAKWGLAEHANNKKWDKYARLQAMFTRATKQGLPINSTVRDSLVTHAQTLKDDPAKVGRYLSDLKVIEQALPTGVPEARVAEAAATIEGPVSGGETIEERITSIPEAQEQERESEVGASSLASEDHPKRNEDHMFSGTYDNGVLVAGVFDGMGGHAGGDVASGKALESVRNLLAKRLEKETNKITVSEAEKLVRRSLEAAQANLERENNGKTSSGRMGTTGCVALVVEGEDRKRTAVVGNVGDSRAWVRRVDGRLEHVTLDDAQWPKEATLEQKRRIQERLAEVESVGDLRDEEIALQLAFMHRNRIAQYLGDKSGIMIGLYKADLQIGDKLLITSDGVHDNLTAQEIQEITASADDAQLTAHILVERAQQYSRTDGGRAKKDDMTAVVMRVGSPSKKKAETAVGTGNESAEVAAPMPLVEQPVPEQPSSEEVNEVDEFKERLEDMPEAEVKKLALEKVHELIAFEASENDEEVLLGHSVMQKLSKSADYLRELLQPETTEDLDVYNFGEKLPSKIAYHLKTFEKEYKREGPPEHLSKQYVKLLLESHLLLKKLFKKPSKKVKHLP